MAAPACCARAAVCSGSLRRGHAPAKRRAQLFKLALWSALVFFDHGSEMQLATALVVNVLQLCVQIDIKPMGGDDAWLLNVMQTCTLVLTTYINFGALCLNYLELSKDFAAYTDPARAGEFDSPIEAISVLMQVLTFGLLITFTGAALKKVALSGVQKFGSLVGRVSVLRGGAEPGGDEETPNSVEMVAAQVNPLFSPSARASGDPALVEAGWSVHASAEGKPYYINESTGATTWTKPAADHS